MIQVFILALYVLGVLGVLGITAYCVTVGHPYFAAAILVMGLCMFSSVGFNTRSD